jgi:hypothetical protein
VDTGGQSRSRTTLERSLRTTTRELWSLPSLTCGHSPIWDPPTLVSEFHEHPQRALTRDREGRWRCAWSLVSLKDVLRPSPSEPAMGCATAANECERAVVFSSASLPDGVALKACGSRSELQGPASLLSGRL